MTPRLEVRGGGAPSREEAAAIVAAASAVLDESASRVVDPMPAAYRSAWRRAAIVEGRRNPAGPGR